MLAYRLNTLMKSIVAAVILSISTFGYAQTNPNCGDAKEVIKYLHDTYKERMVWVGKTDQGTNYAIMGNSEEKTWTMIHFNDKVACIVQIGGEFIAVPQGSKAKIRTRLPE